MARTTNAAVDTGDGKVPNALILKINRAISLGDELITRKSIPNRELILIC